MDQEKTIGSRVAVEVTIESRTKIELYDYGSGVGLRIGEFYGSNVYLRLGFDAETRRHACERLIAVLYAAREWKPSEPDPEPAEPEAVPA